MDNQVTAEKGSLEAIEIAVRDWWAKAKTWQKILVVGAIIAIVMRIFSGRRRRR